MQLICLGNKATEVKRGSIFLKTERYILKKASFCSISVACFSWSDGNELRMWYTSPGSASDWENTSLVIGNGKTGGILFGQVANDQIHFNEKTLWTGGPSESRPNYDGGNRDEAVTEEQLEALRQKQERFPLRHLSGARQD